MDNLNQELWNQVGKPIVKNWWERFQIRPTVRIVGENENPKPQNNKWTEENTNLIGNLAASKMLEFKITTQVGAKKPTTNKSKTLSLPHQNLFNLDDSVNTKLNENTITEIKNFFSVFLNREKFSELFDLSDSNDDPQNYITKGTLGKAIYRVGADAKSLEENKRKAKIKFSNNEETKTDIKIVRNFNYRFHREYPVGNKDWWYYYILKNDFEKNESASWSFEVARKKWYYLN